MPFACALRSPAARLVPAPLFQVCGFPTKRSGLASSIGVPLGNTTTKPSRSASVSQRVASRTLRVEPPAPWSITTSGQPSGGASRVGTTRTAVRCRPSAVPIRNCRSSGTPASGSLLRKQPPTASAASAATATKATPAVRSTARNGCRRGVAAGSIRTVGSKGVIRRTEQLRIAHGTGW